MQKKASTLLAATLLIVPSLCCHADNSYELGRENTIVIIQPSVKNIPSFTGKITKNKVRMRLQPTLDSPIVRELGRDEMLILTGETDEFYAAKPTPDQKAYVFRTFVLDNVVEGNRVNVRLEPTLESPVIAQLNSGDKVDGIVSPLNSKWLEISIPEETRFFISKEYVEKVGDAAYMATIERRREEVNRLLNTTYLASQTELQKPYEEINLGNAVDNFNKVIKYYSDFPEQVSRAKELITMIQDAFVQKKIAYLEAKAAQNSVVPVSSYAPAKDNQTLTDIQEQKNRINQIEQKHQQPVPEMPEPVEVHTTAQSQTIINPQIGPVSVNNNIPPARLAMWEPAEQALYQKWLQETGQGSMEEFYQHEKQAAVKIRGTIESYSRNVKNKPGDFVLLNSSRTPVAYLYSTQVDLQSLIGHEINIIGLPRPNNHFAFPAYFVVAVE